MKGKETGETGMPCCLKPPERYVFQKKSKKDENLRKREKTRDSMSKECDKDEMIAFITFAYFLQDD